MAIGKYIPKDIETKWQKKWQEDKIFSPDLDKAKNPYYTLMMFPYPSAEGLHVGNMYAFSGTDIFARFKRMKGYDVFEPIGLDGFGIHSENYALKTNRHPVELSGVTEENFYRQLMMIGNAYDWTRTVETYKPDYYKWTQWLFIQMYKKGLAYRKKSSVNWCPSCLTVLADEQVISGECERCGSKVEQKELEQWFFKITDYVERLLKNLENIDWSEKVKIAQRNWIGKSEGVLIKFDGLEVFTTRPDTIFGVTFVVINPEHPLLEKFVTGDQKEEVMEYVQKSKSKTELERKESKEKTGIFTGSYVKNPLSGKDVPVWVADYVLAGYGTGAVMGVPAHDTRDFDFATKYGLSIIPVVKKNEPVKSYLMGADDITDQELKDLNIKIDAKFDGDRGLVIPQESIKAYEQIIKQKIKVGYWNEYISDEIVFIFKHKDGEVERFVLSDQTEDNIGRLGSQFINQPYQKNVIWNWFISNQWYKDLFIHSEEGILINSGHFNGLKSSEAREKISEYIEKNHLGKIQTQYHLRDWLISRQRYWGPPIPIIYCNKCGMVPVSEEDLPVMLPFVDDFRPKGTGKSPLSTVDEFINVKCPKCSSQAKRETDVSDTFLDSSWYFLRYPSTEFNNKPFDNGRVDKWLPVDMYIGGAEHSVLHLLYSRFVTMVLHDLGLIDFEEPFIKFRAHGLIIKGGAKMSKSKGNVVNPDDYIKDYGADTLRIYLMFLGPYDQGGDFNDDAVSGIYRFLQRSWGLFQKLDQDGKASEGISNKDQLIMHKTIKKVSDDIEGLRFNTAIAALMEWLNHLSKKEKVPQKEYKTFLLLLAPFAPHITEELWQQLAVKNPEPTNNWSIHQQSWPEVDAKYLEKQDVEVVVQVDGKVRDIMLLSKDMVSSSEVVEKMAKESSKVQKFLNGKSVKKVVYIPLKIINFVTGSQ